MKKKFFWLLVIFVALVGIVLLLSKTSFITAINDRSSELEVLGSDEEGIDSITIKEKGGVSEVRNSTHDYSIEIPNEWKLEVLADSFKIYGPEPNRCLINTYIYTNNPPIIKNEEVRTDHGRITTIVENIENVGADNLQARMLRRYENGKISEETVFVSANDKVYSISSSYGKIKDDRHDHHETNYDICGDLFVEVLESLHIN